MKRIILIIATLTLLAPTVASSQLRSPTNCDTRCLQAQYEAKLAAEAAARTPCGKR